MSEKSIRMHYIIIIAIALLASIPSWGARYPDSETYTKTANYFFGYADAMRYEFRMMRPGTMLLAEAIEPFFGVGNSFAVVNVFFWTITTILLYKLTLKMYKKPRLSLYASILFSVSIPLLSFGSAVLTETAGYLAVMLIIYVIYHIKANIKLTEILTMSLVLGAALLLKETSFFIIPLYFVLAKFGNRKAFAKGTVVIVLAFALASLYFFAYNVDPYSPLKVAREYTSGNQNVFSTKTIFLSFVVFLYLPLFTFLGFMGDNDKKRLRNYIAMFIAILPIFFFPNHDMRITFMMFPLFLPLASLGILVFSDKMREKPIFSRVDSRVYELLIILLFAVIGIYYTYTGSFVYRIF